jgi:hypothetical protein
MECYRKEPQVRPRRTLKSIGEHKLCNTRDSCKQEEYADVEIHIMKDKSKKGRKAAVSRTNLLAFACLCHENQSI